MLIGKRYSIANKIYINIMNLKRKAISLKPSKYPKTTSKDNNFQNPIRTTTT